MLVCFARGGHSYHGKVCKVCGFVKKKTSDQKENDGMKAAVSSRNHIRVGDKISAKDRSSDTRIEGSVQAISYVSGEPMSLVLEGGVRIIETLWEIEVTEPAYQIPTEDGIYIDADIQDLTRATIFVRRNGRWGTSTGNGDQALRTYFISDRIQLVRLVREAQ